MCVGYDSTISFSFVHFLCYLYQVSALVVHMNCCLAEVSWPSLISQLSYHHQFLLLAARPRFTHGVKTLQNDFTCLDITSIEVNIDPIEVIELKNGRVR